MYSFISRMLRASQREMLKVYRVHKVHSGACNSASLRLILAYAVECGLKVLLMSHYKVTQYSDLPVEAQIGHDIRTGLKQLRATETIRFVRTNHGQDPQQDVPPANLHQAFRYGIPLTLTNEVTEDLQRVLAWIDARL
jgi:hypothetical protein